MAVQSPIKYPSGKEHTEIYVPMGKARFQQWWCHQMLDHYMHFARSDDYTRYYSLYKKLMKELYRKEYYEKQGWNFTFKIMWITVVEIGPWVRTYHAWIGVYGEKITIQLPKVKA